MRISPCVNTRSNGSQALDRKSINLALIYGDVSDLAFCGRALARTEVDDDSSKRSWRPGPLGFLFGRPGGSQSYVAVV